MCTNTIIKCLAYHSYVRPIVEYACVVCSPYLKADINRTEMVQHRAARFALNEFSRYASVTRMLNLLEWPTLEQRHNAARILTFYN